MNEDDMVHLVEPKLDAEGERRVRRLDVGFRIALVVLAALWFIAPPLQQAAVPASAGVVGIAEAQP